MLSYKQWKMLNESVMPSFNLGVVNPSNLGLQTQSAFTMDIEEAKMAKKKAKKKMFGDDDETGDGEMVEPASDKDDPDVDVKIGDDKGSCDGDKCGAFSKKKSKKSSKKKCGADMDMDDDHDDKHSGKEDDDDGGDEDELMFSKKKAKKKMMKSKKKMWGDDDDAGEGDEDDDDHHDEEEHENDDDDEDDFDGEDDGDGDDDEEDDQVAKGKFNLGGKGGDAGGGSGMGDAGPMFSKKKSKKASKKKMTAEATEDEKWWNSVRNMTGSNPDQKYGDGWTEYQTTAEDLFTPVNTENLTQAVRPGQGNEPGPGEVGFAPQGRLN